MAIAIAMSGDNPEWDAYDEGRAAERIIVGVERMGLMGAGSASLDATLGLSYSAEVRGLLIVVGVLGALVALAISRIRPVERPAAGPPWRGLTGGPP